MHTDTCFKYLFDCFPGQFWIPMRENKAYLINPLLFLIAFDFFFSFSLLFYDFRTRNSGKYPGELKNFYNHALLHIINIEFK